MLILTRYVNESIIINDDIKILISAINGKQVRIAIDAPRELPIVRSELLDREPNCNSEV